MEKAVKRRAGDSRRHGKEILQTISAQYSDLYLETLEIAVQATITVACTMPGYVDLDEM